MEDKKKHILTISPLLRGLTFDGEKGKFVTFSEGISEESDDALSIDLDLSNEDAGKGVVGPFKNYSEVNGKYPAKVVVKDLGTFSIGNTFDEAKQGVAYNAATLADDSRDSVVLNKISVVTGGAQGFGESIVRYLVNAGSLVFIADINMDGAKALSEKLNKEHGKTVSLPVMGNVSDEGSVEDMIFDIVKLTGGVDVFVSNAGVLKAGSVKEISLKDFNFVTQVNYIGFFLCVKALSPVLALQNSVSGEYYSDIVQINSKSGLEGSSKNGAYAGGKFGGIGLMQSFAMELIEDNIKVNSVCPGNFFDGPLWSDPNNGLFVQYLRAGKVEGAKTVEDVQKFYENKVPMKRGCDGVDVVRAIFYVVEQKYETGQAVPVTGGQVMLK